MRYMNISKKMLHISQANYAKINFQKFQGGLFKIGGSGVANDFENDFLRKKHFKFSLIISLQWHVLLLYPPNCL